MRIGRSTSLRPSFRSNDRLLNGTAVAAFSKASVFDAQEHSENGMMRRAGFIIGAVALLAAAGGPAWAKDAAPMIIGVPPYTGELSCEAAGPIGMRITNIGSQAIIAGAKVAWTLIGSSETGITVLDEELAPGARHVLDNGRADGAVGTFACKAKIVRR